MVKRAGIFLFTFAALFVFLWANLVPEKLNVRPGMVAPKNIVAPRETVNRIQTEIRREQAAAAVPEQYNQDPAITAWVLDGVRHTFDVMVEVATDTQGDSAAKAEKLKSLLPTKYPPEVFTAAAAANPEILSALAKETLEIVGQVLRLGVREEGLDLAVKQVSESVHLLDYPPELRNIAVQVAKAYLRPNVIFNREATERLRQKARDSVEPVKVLADQLIVWKGEPITEEHMAILRDLNLLGSQTIDPKLLIGLALFIGGLLAITIFYLHIFLPTVLKSDHQLLLLSLITIITLMIARGFGEWSPYLAPVATGTMLIAALLDARLAVLFSLLFSLLTGLLFENKFPVTLVALLSSAAGALSVTRLKERSDLTKAGLFVSLASVSAIVAAGLLNNAQWEREFGNALLEIIWGIANGLLSAVLTVGFLPFFENYFGITSSFKLLELTNPNHPLLKRMLLEAPGTYHHCVLVGNLAEAAAQVIGADPLLARAGAYFHDIGKIKRPYFFIENQVAGENPHDKTNPQLSAYIIISHVEDGRAYAEEYRLPKPVKDIIEQHHGNGLVAFFYHKALENQPPDGVNEGDFRYGGPKPQSKEAALVMLADAVEAAIRSVAKPTPQKVETTVKKIIQDRLADGQLDDSALTFRDLHHITATFVRVVSGIVHTRIEYPDMVKEFSKQRGVHGGNLCDERAGANTGNG